MNDYTMTAAVVSVVGPDGNELRINRSDFDAAPEGTYTKWDAASAPINASTGKPAKGKSGKATPPPADRQLSVIDEDGRFYVADGDGNKVEDEPDHYSADGYATDVEAWSAITAAIGK